MQTLGSEFTFHPSIRQSPRKDMAVIQYQLKTGSKWETQNVIPEDKCDAIRAVLNKRNRPEGKVWRFTKVTAPRKTANKPAEESVKPD